MTDEERKKLIAELRDPSVYYVTGTCLAAAEEIERLAAELVKTQRLCGDMVQSQYILERKLLKAKGKATLSSRS